jgi:glucose-6-phosphate-specific signal transduction histidine kinase
MDCLKIHLERQKSLKGVKTDRNNGSKTALSTVVNLSHLLHYWHDQSQRWHFGLQLCSHLFLAWIEKKVCYLFAHKIQPSSWMVFPQPLTGHPVLHRGDLTFYVMFFFLIMLISREGKGHSSFRHCFTLRYL